MIAAILATDMGHHFEMCASLSERGSRLPPSLVLAGRSSSVTSTPRHRPTMPRRGSASARHEMLGAGLAFDPSSDSDRQELVCALVHWCVAGW